MKIDYIEKIFFDLDGTLLNPQCRLYYLFKELTDCDLSFEDYWKLKKRGMNQSDMLDYVGYNTDSKEMFKKLWLNNVERADLLALDEPFEDVVVALHELKLLGFSLYVVTNRQSYDGLTEQLKAIGIFDLFSKVITTFQKYKKDKAIEKAGVRSEKAIFVGDSDEDMKAAMELDIPAVYISRENENVATISYDYKIHSLNEIRGLLS